MGDTTANLHTPEPIINEHQEFRDELLTAIKIGGESGNVASQIAEILNPHFKKEEEFAFPPLILMAPLARDEINPSMKDALGMIEQLKKELSILTDDHIKIILKLEYFDRAIKFERLTEFTIFSKRLIHHSRAKEGILYPAAIILGKFIRMYYSELIR